MRALLLSMALLPLLAFSAESTPNLIDYSGRLTDTAGTPLPTGLVEVEFRLWSQPIGGLLIWAEKQYLSVEDGNFSTRLGEGEPIINAGVDIGLVNQRSPGLAGAFYGTQRFLGITVKRGGTAAELSPRTAFASIPFALLAQTANNLEQAPDTSSRIRVSSIAYSTQTVAASTTLVLNKHTNLVNAASAPVTATLPSNGAHQTLIVTKTDPSANMVRILPGAGKINNTTKPLYLKVRGESVTVQNTGGDNWWVIADSRDLTPVGTIISFGGATVPPGFLPCDGVSHPRTNYVELSDALRSDPAASAWGGNTTHFNVPNLRGQFLRGAGSGVRDPDAASRSSSAAGGNSGGKVGSLQGDLLASHAHPYTLPPHSHTWNSGGGYGPARTSVAGSDSTGTSFDGDGSEINTKDQPSRFSLHPSSDVGGTSGAAGGNETRPVNAFVNFIIKY
jgi:hypothetical protein